MANPFTTQIYYPDGDPENMREITTSGWTGRVFYIHRDYWGSAVEEYRDSLQKPGVYVLAGDDSFEDGDDLQRVYIGHANNLRTRISQHIKDSGKGFFQSIVCVVENGSFTSAHFKWMESHLIEKAGEINRCDLDNENEPGKPHVSKAHEADIKNFLEKACQLFPIAGIKAFIKPKTIQREAGKDIEVEEKREKAPGLREKVLIAFQDMENITLLERSRATFYDESKTTCVGCYISKLYEHGEKQSFWFAPSSKVVDFLQNADKGYLLFGMEGQAKAVALSIKEFSEIKEKLNPAYDKGTNQITQWHVRIYVTGGSFELGLQRGERRDLSEYAFDLE